jgi:hypothetical protein
MSRGLGALGAENVFDARTLSSGSNPRTCWNLSIHGIVTTISQIGWREPNRMPSRHVFVLSADLRLHRIARDRRSPVTAILIVGVAVACFGAGAALPQFRNLASGACACFRSVRWLVLVLIWWKWVFSACELAGKSSMGQVTRDRRRYPFQKARGITSSSACLCPA